MRIQRKTIFRKLIITYLISFISTFVIYTSLDWFVSVEMAIGIKEDYLNFWIPAGICLLITFFIFRPIVKQLKYTPKTKDLMLWFVLPFTIWLPIAFSQEYFKDISYKLISINKPSDIFKYPKERFFKIKSFTVAPNYFSMVWGSNTSDRYGTTLHVFKHYIVPVFNDTSEILRNQLSKIGYGIIFSTSMHNGPFDKDIQAPIIDSFDKKSTLDYNNYDFYTVSYLEKIQNTNDVDYYLKAIERNGHFDKNIQPIIIVKRNGLNDLYQKDKNLFLYSTLVSLFFGLITILLIKAFN